MTKTPKSAPADPARTPEAEASASGPDATPVFDAAEDAPEPPPLPADKAHAVLLREANGVRRGIVVRGSSAAIGDLIADKAARIATETDLAVAGRNVVDL